MNSQQLRSFNLAITPSATKSPSETDRDSMFSLTDKSLALSSGNYPCNAVRERAESYCLIERDSSKYQIEHQSLKGGAGLQTFAESLGNKGMKTIKLRGPSGKAFCGFMDLFEHSQFGMDQLMQTLTSGPESAIDSLIQGFNICIFQINPSYQNLDKAAANFKQISETAVKKMLEQITLYAQDDFKVLVSMFKLSDSPSKESITDMLTGQHDTSIESDFLNVQISSYEQYQQLAEVASELMPCYEESTYFIRLSLYNQHKKRISKLHIIQHPLEEKSLLCLVLKESFEQIQKHLVGGPQSILNKGLSQILKFIVPVLYGNSKAFAFSLVSDNVSKNSALSILETLERISGIKVSLQKCEGVSFTDMESTPFLVFAKQNKHVQIKQILRKDNSRRKQECESIQDTKNSLRLSNELVSSIRGAGTSPLETSHNFKRSQVSPNAKERSNSKERIGKMREIKSEIGDLMSKIDMASRQIFDSFNKPPSPKQQFYPVSPRKVEQQSYSPQISTCLPHKIYSGGTDNQSQSIQQHENIPYTKSQDPKSTKQLQSQPRPPKSTLKEELSIQARQIHGALLQQQNASSSIQQTQNLKDKQLSTAIPETYVTFSQDNQQADLNELMLMKRSYEQLAEIVKDQSSLIDQKSSHIQALTHEIQEVKLRYELELDQARLQLKHQQQRLLTFESQSDVKDILQVFNEQTVHLESQNKSLITQLRKLAKVQANEIKMQSSDRLSESAQYESKTCLYEKNTKSLKTSISKLVSQLKKAQVELEEFRKKDRLFNLQKRCVEDSIKKANLYYKKLNQSSNQVSELQKVNLELTNEQKNNIGFTKALQFRVAELEGYFATLKEENMLLRDFTYNVDPQAKPLHAQQFMANKENFNDQKHLLKLKIDEHTRGMVAEKDPNPQRNVFIFKNPIS